jgi:hypothetical protein
MSGVGLVIAAGYAISQDKSFVLIATLFALGLVFLAASFWAEWIQHSVECMAFKDRPIEAMMILAMTGILRTEDVEAIIELSDLKDKKALKALERDIVLKKQASSGDT